MRAILLAGTALATIAASPTPNPCPAPTTPVSASGYFTASSSQILDPSGKPFQVRGVNVYLQDIASAITNEQAQPLTSTFPGVNLVRIGVQDLSSNSVAQLQPYIATLSALGIVAEIEDWNYPTTDDGASGNFMSQIAATTKGNAYVWYASPNEPQSSQTDAGVRATYNAVRGAGNGTLVLIQASGGTSTAGMSDYSGWSNIAGTIHQYAWVGGNSTNTGTQLSALQNNAQALRGLIGNGPIIVDEYGYDCCGGGGYDQGWQAVVNAVQQSGWGSAAFVWVGPMVASWGSNGAVNDLTNYPSNSLTPFGHMVQPFIAASTSAQGGTYQADAYAQPLCQLSQAIYPTAESDASGQLAAAQAQAQQDLSQTSQTPAQPSSSSQNQQVASGTESTGATGSAASSPPPAQAVPASDNPASVASPPMPPPIGSAGTAAVAAAEAQLQQAETQLQQSEAELATLQAQVANGQIQQQPTLTPSPAPAAPQAAATQPVAAAVASPGGSEGGGTDNGGGSSEGASGGGSDADSDGD